MSLLQIIVLAAVQGLAELLPVSSSAHVIVAEKLMGLDPSKPEMTLLLVLLHTGTMFAVIVYFWQAWKKSIFASREVFKRQVVMLAVATLATLIVGLPLIKGIEKVTGDEVESLFRNVPLIAAALAAAGVLILIAGLVHRRQAARGTSTFARPSASARCEGLCLPFRGFSVRERRFPPACFWEPSRPRPRSSASPWR